MVLAAIVDWLGTAWAGHDRQVAFLSMTASVLALFATVAIAAIVARTSHKSSKRSQDLAEEVAELTRQSRVEALRQQLRDTDDSAHAQMLIERGRTLTAEERNERVDLEAVAAANVVVPLPRSREDLPDDLTVIELARVLESALSTLPRRHEAGALEYGAPARTAVELTVLAEKLDVSPRPVAEMLGRHFDDPVLSSHELITGLFSREHAPARTTMLRQLPAYLELLKLGSIVPINTVVNVMTGVSEVVMEEGDKLSRLPEVADGLAAGYRWAISGQSRRMAETAWDMGMTAEPVDALADAIVAAVICEAAGSGRLQCGLTGPVAAALKRLADGVQLVVEPHRHSVIEAVQALINAEQQDTVSRRLQAALDGFIAAG